MRLVRSGKLIEIAGDASLAEENAPSGGWLPVRAVYLLGELRAAEACIR